MLTDECTDHSAIPGHNLLNRPHTQPNFYPEYFCLPLDGLLSISRLGQLMKYSHCSPESQNFYWVLLLQTTSCNKISSFSHRLPHRVFFSLRESSNHRKHHQPKHLGRRSHTDGLRESKCCYQEVFWEMWRKAVFQS